MEQIEQNQQYEQKQQHQYEQEYYYETLQHNRDVEVNCTPDPRRYSLSSFMVRTPHTLCARRSHDMRTSLEHYDRSYLRQLHYANCVDNSTIENKECGIETPQPCSVAPERVSNDLYPERNRHEQAEEHNNNNNNFCSELEHKSEEFVLHKQHRHFATTTSSSSSSLTSHFGQPVSSFAGLQSSIQQKEMSSIKMNNANETMNGSAHSAYDLWHRGGNNNSSNNNEKNVLHSSVHHVNRTKNEMRGFSSETLQTEEQQEEKSLWSMQKAVTPFSRHCHQRGSDDWVPQRRFSPFMCNQHNFRIENNNNNINLDSHDSQDNNSKKIVNENLNDKSLHTSNTYYMNTNSAIEANSPLLQQEQHLSREKQYCCLTLHRNEANVNLCSKDCNYDVEDDKRDSCNSAFVDSPEQARYLEKCTLHECRDYIARGKSLTPAQRNRCCSSSMYNTCSARGAESPSVFIMGRPTNLLFAKNSSASKLRGNKTQETNLTSTEANIVVNNYSHTVDGSADLNLGEYTSTFTFHNNKKNKCINHDHNGEYDIYLCNNNNDDDDDDDEEEILIARPDFAHSLSAANEPATTRNSPRLPLFVDVDEINMYRKSRDVHLIESSSELYGYNIKNDIGISINCISTISEKPLPLETEHKCTDINNAEILHNLRTDKLSEELELELEEEEELELRERQSHDTIKERVTYSNNIKDIIRESNSCDKVIDANNCVELQRRLSSKHLEMLFIEDAPRKPDCPSKKKETTRTTTTTTTSTSSTELPLMSSFTTLADGKELMDENAVNYYKTKRISNDNNIVYNDNNDAIHMPYQAENGSRRCCPCRSLHECNVFHDTKGLYTLEHRMQLPESANDAFYTQEQEEEANVESDKIHLRHIQENGYVLDSVSKGKIARNSFICSNEESTKEALKDNVFVLCDHEDDVDNENWSYCTNSSVTYAKTLTKSFEMTEEFVHLQVEPSPTQKRLAFDECLEDNSVKSQVTFNEEESVSHDECRTLNYVNNVRKSTQEIESVCHNNSSNIDKSYSAHRIQSHEGRSTCLSKIDVNQLPESRPGQQRSKCKNVLCQNEVQQPFCKSGLQLLYSRKRFLDDATRNDMDDNDNKPASNIIQQDERDNVCVHRRPLQVIRHKRVCHECHFLPNAHKT